MDNYADFSTTPPFHGRQTETFYDEGQGIPQINSNNITQQDIFRTPFLFTQEHKRDNNAMVKTAEKSISQNSVLSQMFFSDKNIKRIQKKIKKEVSIRTKHEFKLDVDQDETDLIIAMVAIFKTKARHLPGQTIRQIKRLNNQVVDYIIPDMITNIKQHYGYIKEINEPIKPIMRPVNVSNAGRKTLPSITTSWGMRK
jgi:hypothetical protein